MKKMLVALLITVLAVAAIAGPYSFQQAVICGSTSGTSDTTFANVPGFSHAYAIAAAGNNRIWTHSYSTADDRYDMAIMVYDPVDGIIDTIGPEIEGADGTLDTLDGARFMATTGDGNVVYGDYKNKKIRVFDKETYECIGETPGTDANVSGGVGAFVYDDEQYYLSQTILGTTIIVWDADFNAIDTLTGGPGGRNLTCTPDGNVIVAPSLGSTYFIEWTGNPADGYVSDTVWMADLADNLVEKIMYVSSGPNDYFWLMSRDLAKDGILVVDPKNDYEVKLTTYTDSSVTSIDAFDLGMAMDNMGLI